MLVKKDFGKFIAILLKIAENHLPEAVSVPGIRALARLKPIAPRELSEASFRKTVPGRAAITEAIHRLAAKHGKQAKCVADETGTITLPKVAALASRNDWPPVTIDMLAKTAHNHFEVLFREEQGARYGTKVFGALTDACEERLWEVYRHFVEDC